MPSSRSEVWQQRCLDTSASVPGYLDAGVQLLVVAVRDVLPLGAGDRVVVLHHRHRLGQRPGQLRGRRQGQVPPHCQLSQGLQPQLITGRVNIRAADIGSLRFYNHEGPSPN